MKRIMVQAAERRDFISLGTLWMFIKVLIAMEALYYSMGMPIEALAVAVIMVIAIYEINRI